MSRRRQGQQMPGFDALIDSLLDDDGDDSAKQKGSNKKGPSAAMEALKKGGPPIKTVSFDTGNSSFDSDEEIMAPARKKSQAQKDDVDSDDDLFSSLKTAAKRPGAGSRTQRTGGTAGASRNNNTASSKKWPAPKKVTKDDDADDWDLDDDFLLDDGDDDIPARASRQTKSASTSNHQGSAAYRPSSSTTSLASKYSKTPVSSVVSKGYVPTGRRGQASAPRTSQARAPKDAGAATTSKRRNSLDDLLGAFDSDDEASRATQGQDDDDDDDGDDDSFFAAIKGKKSSGSAQNAVSTGNNGARGVGNQAVQRESTHTPPLTQQNQQPIASTPAAKNPQKRASTTSIRGGRAQKGNDADSDERIDLAGAGDDDDDDWFDDGPALPRSASSAKGHATSEESQTSPSAPAQRKAPPPTSRDADDDLFAVLGAAKKAPSRTGSRSSTSTGMAATGGRTSRNTADQAEMDWLVSGNTTASSPTANAAAMKTNAEHASVPQETTEMKTNQANPPPPAAPLGSTISGVTHGSSTGGRNGAQSTGDNDGNGDGGVAEVHGKQALKKNKARDDDFFSFLNKGGKSDGGNGGRSTGTKKVTRRAQSESLFPQSLAPQSRAPSAPLRPSETTSNQQFGTQEQNAEIQRLSAELVSAKENLARKVNECSALEEKVAAANTALANSEAEHAKKLADALASVDDLRAENEELSTSFIELQNKYDTDMKAATRKDEENTAELMRLRERVGSLDTVLRDELDKSNDRHRQAILKLQEEGDARYQALLERKQAEIDSIRATHKDELQNLRAAHELSLSARSTQHQAEIDAIIANTKQQVEAMRTNADNTRTIEEILGRIQGTTDGVESLQSKLRSSVQAQLDEREARLSEREKTVSKIMSDFTKKQEELDKERWKLQQTVASLESEMKQQRTELEKRQWRISQDEARLSASFESLEEQRKAVLDQAHEEQLQIQSLRDGLTRERKEMLRELSEQRREIADEKAHLKQLHRELERKERAKQDAISEKIADSQAEMDTIRERRNALDQDIAKLRSDQVRLQKQQQENDETQRHLQQREEKLRHVAAMVEEKSTLTLALHKRAQEDLAKARDMQARADALALAIANERAELISLSNHLKKEENAFRATREKEEAALAETMQKSARHARIATSLLKAKSAEEEEKMALMGLKLKYEEINRSLSQSLRNEHLARPPLHAYTYTSSVQPGTHRDSIHGEKGATVSGLRDTATFMAQKPPHLSELQEKENLSASTQPAYTGRDKQVHRKEHEENVPSPPTESRETPTALEDKDSLTRPDIGANPDGPQRRTGDGPSRLGSLSRKQLREVLSAWDTQMQTMS